MSRHKGNGDEDERRIAELRAAEQAAQDAEKIANAEKMTREAMRIQRQARERGE
jgi:hypothetical protein